MLPQDDKSVLIVLMAAIAGLIRYLRDVAAKRAEYSHGTLILEALSSGFVGLLSMMLCQAFGLPESWTGVIVGVMGWLGAETSIKIIEKHVIDKLK